MCVCVCVRARVCARMLTDGNGTEKALSKVETPRLPSWPRPSALCCSMYSEGPGLAAALASPGGDHEGLVSAPC